MRPSDAVREAPHTRWSLVLALISVAVLMVMVSLRTGEMRSVELTFADASPSGLGVVPASCESSYPHYTSECTCPTELDNTGDSGGYAVLAGSPARKANRNGIFVCISNGSGNTYFLPTRSTGEMQTFQNASSRLPGVSVTAP